MEQLHYIPDRYTEGYGISYQGIDSAFAKGIQLIIALDCGVKALDKVAYAKEKRDRLYHMRSPFTWRKLPDTIALLNPKQPNCTYPFKELCGCGIGFKLLQALTQFWKEDQSSIHSYLGFGGYCNSSRYCPDGRRKSRVVFLWIKTAT